MGSSKSIGKRLNVWGLTGGIGSGKTTVGQIFLEMGCPIVDADEIAKKLRSPKGAAEKPILQAFGTQDAKQLRQIIFGDAMKRKKLEAIMHPLIQEESNRRFERAAKERKDKDLPILYEASQIIEAGRVNDFAGIIVITAPEALRLKRVTQSRGLSPSEVLLIIQSQMPDSERIKSAQVIIENTQEGLDHLRQDVTRALETIKSNLS